MSTFRAKIVGDKLCENCHRPLGQHSGPVLYCSTPTAEARAEQREDVLRAAIVDLIREAECGWQYAPDFDKHGALERIDRIKASLP